MSQKLVARLQDIPGVASVSLNLEDVEPWIRVRLEEEIDEAEVLERVRALLVAYGVRSQDHPSLQIGHGRIPRPPDLGGVEIRMTPIKGGARVEVVGRSVRSFRVVPPNPLAISQGLSDAWCQVLGMIPLEISRVSLGDTGILCIVASDGELERAGRADVRQGWERAVAHAVGQAIGALSPDSDAKDSDLAHTGW